ncbi:hypothetical protein DCC79_03135 [bacterium]|nr:MAG: hypothetical protein DCC79_03135 [bacterium]
MRPTSSAGELAAHRGRPIHVPPGGPPRAPAPSPEIFAAMGEVQHAFHERRAPRAGCRVHGTVNAVEQLACADRRHVERRVGLGRDPRREVEPTPLERD